MRLRSFLGAFTLAALFVLTPGSAHAELNLWVSYHFAGMDNYDAGEYQNAMVLYQEALDESDTGGRRTKHRRADSLNGLGRVHHAVGNFDEAKKYYEQALDLKKHAVGRRHRDLPQTLNNLADLHYILEEKPEQVEALYRQALDINERDQFNIEVSRSLNGLALVHNDRGEYVESENLLLRAVEVNEKAERRDHPYLATVLTNLGILYTNLGRYAEAGPMFDRAKYIHEVALRADHPDVSVRLHATAALYQATGRGSEAVALATQAEAIRATQRSSANLY